MLTGKSKERAGWVLSVIIIPLIMTALAPWISKVMCSSKRTLVLKGQLKTNDYQTISHAVVTIPSVGVDTTDLDGVFEISSIKTEVSRLEWLGCTSCNEDTKREIHFQVGNKVCIQEISWSNNKIGNKIEQLFIIEPSCLK